MNTFHVLFRPELPHAPLNTSRVSDLVDWGRVLARLPGQFSLVYQIGQTSAAYYPAELISIFSDLRGELQYLRSRVSHTVLISGYPVLDALIDGDHISFFHADELTLVTRNPINGLISVQLAERVVRNALQRVWSVVKAAEKS